MLLLAIILVLGLVGAIGRSMEQLWLGVMRTPLYLGQQTVIHLWQAITNKNLTGFSNLANSSAPPDRQITALIDQLRQNQQEQDQLITELLKLVKAKS